MFRNEKIELESKFHAVNLSFYVKKQYSLWLYYIHEPFKKRRLVIPLFIMALRNKMELLNFPNMRFIHLFHSLKHSFIQTYLWGLVYAKHPIVFF